jgi:hypothetical protein
VVRFRHAEHQRREEPRRHGAQHGEGIVRPPERDPCRERCDAISANLVTISRVRRGAAGERERDRSSEEASPSALRRRCRAPRHGAAAISAVST